jgi:hypothetical protein
MRPWLNLSLALLALAALPCPAPAWFGNAAPTLSEEMRATHIVLFGTLRNSTPPNPSGARSGVTDFIIEQRLKSHPALGDRKTLTLPCYVPAARQGSVPSVIYGRVVGGKLRLYGQFPAKGNSDLLKYLAGVIGLQGQTDSRRARFYFDYLRHTESAIAQDALFEFRCIPYPSLREAAANLPADRLAACIKDPKTPVHLASLYALMLGHCSKDLARDCALVQLLAQRARGCADLADVLKGLVLLRPRQGWEEVCSLLRDPARPYGVRLAALRVARFLLESRPDLVSRQQLLAGVTPLLDQVDLVPQAIEFLARGKGWQYTVRVLALHGRPSRDSELLHRAIVRFALRSPEPAAKRFVEEERRRDPEGVRKLKLLLD